MGRWRGKNVERACAKAKRAQEARKKRGLGEWLEAVTRPPGRWAGNALIIHDSIVVEYDQRPSVQKLRRQMSENVSKFLAQLEQGAATDAAAVLAISDHYGFGAWGSGPNLPARRP